MHPNIKGDFQICNGVPLNIFAKHAILYIFWEGSEYLTKFKYARVWGIPGLSICQGSKFLGLPIFVNMAGFWISVEVQLWKGSKHSRIPNIPGFYKCKVTQGSESAWIWLNNAWINCSGYGRILNISGQDFTGFENVSVSKYVRAQNMAGLWICEGYTGSWVCLNKPKISLNNI